MTHGAGYPSDLADALSDANRNSLLCLLSIAQLPLCLTCVTAVCYDYCDATRNAKNELFDEGDDANADFSEAVKNLR